jgi:hypothetical protein
MTSIRTVALALVAVSAASTAVAEDKPNLASLVINF